VKNTTQKTTGKTVRQDAARKQLVDLLYQALETELGGVEIYRTALKCVQNDELRKEWEEYLEQTEEHVTTMRELCAALDLDPDQETPGRQVVRHIGKSLLKAMHMALGADDPGAAELVAAECVVFAETKDHMNWSLIGMLAKQSNGNEARALKAAYDETEDEEDEHLYHTTGWARELWVDALGMKAVLPPPEETQDVKSAIAAARAKQSRM
jgi:rubrerythrin